MCVVQLEHLVKLGVRLESYKYLVRTFKPKVKVLVPIFVILMVCEALEGKMLLVFPTYLPHAPFPT